MGAEKWRVKSQMRHDGKLFKVDETKTSFAFMVDRSGSMWDQKLSKNRGHRLDETRLKFVTNALIATLEGLPNPETTTFSVQTFSGEQISLTGFKDGVMVKNTPEHRKQVKEWLDKIIPVGDSCCRKAIEALEAQPADELFLLADGECSDRSGEASILTHIRKRINVIGVDSKSELFLRKVAGSTDPPGSHQFI